MRIVMLVAALAAAFAAAPARASATRDVTVANFQFTPAVTDAVAGDTIHWTVSSGSHTITAYVGDEFDFGVSAGAEESSVFHGGTVLYRCLFHSSIDDVTLVCSGMCAALTDGTAAPEAPSIGSPADGATLDASPARVEGTAGQGTTNAVFVDGGKVGEAVADGSGAWRLDVTFGRGTHTLTARSADVHGRTSPASTPVSITETADSIPPSATIATASPAIFATQPATIGGGAFDDPDGSGVAGVEIEIAPVTGPSVGPLAAQIRAATCLGCTATTVTWTFDVPAGAWRIRARAVDAAGNAGDFSAPIQVVAGP